MPGYPIRHLRLLLPILLSLGLHADPAANDTAAPTPLTADQRAEGLTKLWSTANASFANFDLVPDLDWDKSYQTYLPLVRAEQSLYDYYRLLRAFLNQLHDGHTGVYLPRSLTQSHEVDPALETTYIEGKVYISALFSPTLAALTQPALAVGDEITAIDDTPVLAYAEKRWGNQVAASTPQDRLRRIFETALLRGPPDQPVKLTLADGRTFDLPRNTPRKPRKPTPCEFRQLPGDIAYFGFHTCSNSQPADEFIAKLPQLQKSKALIIDIRQNSGGSTQVGYDILSHLIDSKITACTWEYPRHRPPERQGKKNKGTNTLSPANGPCYTGPVIVLIGTKTFSAAEDFAVAFDHAKRGLLIGEPTGGSTGQPIIIDLPGGGKARICTKRDRYPDGREFVGKGVIPQIHIPRTAQTLRENRDLALEAALAHLKKP